MCLTELLRQKCNLNYTSTLCKYQIKQKYQNHILSHFSSDDCQTSVNTGFPDILSYLSCPEEVDEAYTFDTASISQLTNGTYCKSMNRELITNGASEGHIFRCDIVGYPGMDVCHKTVGSHTVTFYSYLAARMAFDWTFKGVYALMDGTSLR